MVQTQSPLQKMLRQTLSAIASDTIDDMVNNIDPDTPNVNITQKYVRDLFDRYYEKQNGGNLGKQN